MHLKRLAGLLLMLPLLHLNAARASLSCAAGQGTHDNAGASTVATGHAAHATDGLPGPEHESGSENDGSSAHLTCCLAFGSCSFAFGGETAESIAEGRPGPVTRPSRATSLPRSANRAPEPPPPKA